MSDYSVFTKYEPKLWTPDSQGIYSLPRTHGLDVKYKLHNPNDEINDGRSDLEKVLLEYRINDESVDLFTITDLFDSTYQFEHKFAGNIIGDVAERISRVITQYFIETLFGSIKPEGVTQDDAPKKKDYIVANNEEYVLKIKRFPNLILLKKTGEGKYGYENIKELDSFFDYTLFRQREIIVMESKTGKINVDPEKLVDNLFNPLRELYPGANFSYVLFASTYSIFHRQFYEKRRQICEIPLRIHKRLQDEDVNTLFFDFDESRYDFAKIKNHLITQYRAINKMGVYIDGRTFVSENDIIVFDGGETPHIRLRRDKNNSSWNEMSLTHKKRRKKKK
jgi:hypothetical protein